MDLVFISREAYGDLVVKEIDTTPWAWSSWLGLCCLQLWTLIGMGHLLKSPSLEADGF